MKALNVISRPRSAFAELGAAPDLGRGFGVVLLVALLFTGCELAAAALAGNPTGGVALTLSLPVLFLAFWAVAGWLIDAAAGLLGRLGRATPRRSACPRSSAGPGPPPTAASP